MIGEARIASITAAAAIDGEAVDEDRAVRIAEGSRRLRNRAEHRLAGYRDAFDELLGPEPLEPLSVPYVLHLHRLLAAPAKGGGLRPDPRLNELLLRYQAAKRERGAHPLALLGAFVVDFLAIHPTAEGAALGRLLTARELLAQGYGAIRYFSLERRVYATRDGYLAALRDSHLRWREGAHTVWPWTGYLGGILASLCDELDQRMAATPAQTGSKRTRVREQVLERGPARFRRRDVEHALPGISNGTVRLVLAELREEGKIEADGAGRGAAWRRIAQT
ncbi:MAG TPA: hypothetical protein VFS26_06845 [Solirubrobacterales bacterium]|nr:hypothetical protein [Solirubrobacterales bacterium]